MLSFLHSSVHQDITVGTKVGTSASSSSFFLSLWFAALFAAVTIPECVWQVAAIWEQFRLLSVISVEVARLFVSADSPNCSLSFSHIAQMWE